MLWDGRVSLCCADFDGRTILGDLNTSTIQEIWNAEPYRAARRQHLESGGPDICRSCDLPAQRLAALDHETLSLSRLRRSARARSAVRLPTVALALIVE